MVANSNNDSDLADRHQAPADGRADRQRQPAAGLDRRQQPERHHDAQRQHDPGQHRAGQRPGGLRLQRRRGPRCATRACCRPTSTRSTRSYDAAIGKIVVTNDKGIGARGPAETIDKGPGPPRAPSRSPATTPTTTPARSPSSACRPRQRSAGVHAPGVRQQRLGAPAGQHAAAELRRRPPVAIPARLGCPSTIKHVFLIVRENRTYDQVFGDISKGNGDSGLTPSSAPRSRRTRTRSPTRYGLFDNFYDEGTLSADGHNWLVQADANDYIEKEFGAFYRSYPAQGGDALAYQRDGFLWNAAQAAGQDRQGLTASTTTSSPSRARGRPGRSTTRTRRSWKARPPGRCRCRSRRSTPTPTSRR